jgi:hypothetical protein
MTRRDARAALGCALGIAGLVLLLLDLRDGLRGRREGGRNPRRGRRRDPRLTVSAHTAMGRYEAEGDGW